MGNNNNKMGLIKSVLILGAFMGSSSAMAGSAGTGDVLAECQNLPLVLNLAPYSNMFGTTNNTICVDVPVALNKAKVVFNIDAKSIDGSGKANALKHMVMLATALKARIDAGLVDNNDVQIIGIIHGSAVGWASKDDATQYGQMQQIFAFQQAGMNIQLEVCGVTMRSKGWTKANIWGYDAEGNVDPLAPGRIYVNQGAIGRLIDLEQNKFAYINEG